MKAFIFNKLSACLRLFTSTSRLLFLVFFTVFWVSLVEITFSMRKGVNLAWKTSSKNSITMNLGKSAASFSESDSDRFRLVLLFEDAIYAVYFSLALRSTPHHGVQLVLGMNQGGNPFALVETRIPDQYVQVEGRFLNRCQFQVLSTGQNPIFSTQLTLSHRLLAPKRLGLGISCKCWFKSTVGIKNRC